MKYNHLQIAKPTIALVMISAAISIYYVMLEDYSKYAPNWMDASNWNWWGIAILVLVYLIVLNFALLRIQIDKQYLYWHFGMGIFKKKVELAEINSVAEVKNKWWYGWGIRKLISGGWLYNVYGLDAVEIKTKQGKIIRLGTDEPKRLYRALISATQIPSGNEADPLTQVTDDA